VLIAPFCRPTPHAPMLGLRLANMPLVGPLLRHAVIPRLAPALGERKLRHAFAPAPVPRSLEDFPFAHAAKPGSPQTMSGELLAFNRDMSLCRRTTRHIEAPTHVLCAPDDSVTDLQWHVSWLTEWTSDCVVHFLRAGHLIHHAQPHAILLAIRALEAQVSSPMAA
jgi:pimeloyl-ACP methyl ester carboxylesterase